jgi:hypothetical protein
MSECWLTWPVSIDEHPPTQEELKLCVNNWKNW